MVVKMIRLDKGEHKKQEYLDINPLGKVQCQSVLLWDCRASPMSHEPWNAFASQHHQL